MYVKYTELRDEKGLTDYRVSVDTGFISLHSPNGRAVAVSQR